MNANDKLNYMPYIFIYVSVEMNKLKKIFNFKIWKIGCL